MITLVPVSCGTVDTSPDGCGVWDECAKCTARIVHSPVMDAAINRDYPGAAVIYICMACTPEPSDEALRLHIEQTKRILRGTPLGHFMETLTSEELEKWTRGRLAAARRPVH